MTNTNNAQILLENQLCFKLYTATRLTTQAYEPFLKKLGITYTQYLVLLTLWQQDRQPVNDIGKQLLLGINTMSPLIKRMEKMNLVERQESPIDKRQQIVCLTQKAKEMQKEAEQIPTYMANKLESCGIETQKLVELVPVLNDYIEKMSNK